MDFFPVVGGLRRPPPAQPHDPYRRDERVALRLGVMTRGLRPRRPTVTSGCLEAVHPSSLAWVRHACDPLGHNHGPLPTV